MTGFCLGFGHCWRCNRDRDLVVDPLMPPTDTIGVCGECAAARKQLPPERSQRTCER